MSGFETIKLNIHYGGDAVYENKKFSYKGGFVKKDMVVDPDLLTWTIFDEFCQENGVNGLVEQVWYKLPEEDIGSARVVYEEKDAGIIELCSEAVTTGEVDVFLQQGVSVPFFPLSNLGDDIVLEEGDDPRFAAFFDEVNRDVDGENARANGGEGNENGADGYANGGEGNEIGANGGEGNENETNGGEGNENGANGGEGNENGANGGEGNENGADGNENETADGNEAAGNENGEHVDVHLEDEPCIDADHPEPAVETDDEWEIFNREEAVVSKERYQNDKPPYLWFLQTFKSGEEFNDCIDWLLDEKEPDDIDPWSIHNAPKRQRCAQSQKEATTSAHTENAYDPPSTAPPTVSTTGRGRGSGRGRGRPRGRGRGRDSGTQAPRREPVCFMSPWTDKVFDVWRV